MNKVTTWYLRLTFSESYSIALYQKTSVAPEAFQKWGAQIPKRRKKFNVPPHFFVVLPITGQQ